MLCEVKALLGNRGVHVLATGKTPRTEPPWQLDHAPHGLRRSPTQPAPSPTAGASAAIKPAKLVAPTIKTKKSLKSTTQRGIFLAAAAGTLILITCGSQIVAS